MEQGDEPRSVRPCLSPAENGAVNLVLTPFLLFGSAKTEGALFLARAGRIAPLWILLGS